MCVASVIYNWGLLTWHEEPKWKHTKPGVVAKGKTDGIQWEELISTNVRHTPSFSFAPWSSPITSKTCQWFLDSEFSVSAGWNIQSLIDGQLSPLLPLLILAQPPQLVEKYTTCKMDLKFLSLSLSICEKWLGTSDTKHKHTILTDIIFQRCFPMNVDT